MTYTAASPSQIPGMIEPVEQELLVDLTASLDLASDEIVCEFGAFFGRSTHCLADGLLAGGRHRAARPTEALHTFDLFSCAAKGALGPYVTRLSAEAGLDHLLRRDGDRIDWVGVFDHYMADLPPGLLRRHQGPLELARHPGGRIAAMMIDAPKWYPEYLQLLREFGPHARPGCLIVLQDYFYHWSATVIAAVQILIERGDFEPLETAASSLLVRLCRPLTQASLDALDATFRDSSVPSLVDRAFALFRDFDVDRAGVFLMRLALAGAQFVAEADGEAAAQPRLQAALALCGGQWPSAVAADLEDLRCHGYSLRRLYALDTLPS